MAPTNVHIRIFICNHPLGLSGLVHRRRNGLDGQASIWKKLDGGSLMFPNGIYYKILIELFK